MKKILLIFLVCILSFVTTGCVKFDYRIEINKKDRVNVSQVQSFNVRLFRAISPGFDQGFKQSVDALVEKYKKQGLDAKEYNDEEFSGISVSKNNLTFKQAREILPAGFKMDENSLIETKGLVKNSYKLHFKYDIKEALSSPEISIAQRKISAGRSNIILSRNIELKRINGQLVNMTKIKEDYEAIDGDKPSLVPISNLTIKIPAKASKHNADKVLKGNEYQWDLAKDEQPVEITLEYEVFDFSRLMISLSLILLLAAVIYMVQKLQNGDVVKGL